MTAKRYGLAVILLGLAGLICAEPLGPSGFELYSWPVASGWNFVVLEGTTTTRSLAAIKSSKTRLKNVTYLKGRLASLPDGETVYWRENKKRGLILPPKEIVRDLNEFARTSQLKLLLPGQTVTNKANEEINSDFQTITE
jgi:hypothetical protein